MDHLGEDKVAFFWLVIPEDTLLVFLQTMQFVGAYDASLATGIKTCSNSSSRIRFIYGQPKHLKYHLYLYFFIISPAYLHQFLQFFRNIVEYMLEVVHFFLNKRVKLRKCVRIYRRNVEKIKR